MKVGIGISGGIDSTAAALLLQKAGYQLAAYTMRNTEASVSRAEQVAARLNIPLTVLDLRSEFHELIVKYFGDEYAAGRTPSPCVLCNRLIKFGLLKRMAMEDGCDRFATGHYALLENGSLFRGKDASKDQSYFLAQVPAEEFRNVMFPLGEMLKTSVRELVCSRGLLPPDCGESQDLCFVDTGDFTPIVLDMHPELDVPGEIVTGDGRVLGHHKGAFSHTVGQRRGLGLGGGPWFVLGVDIPERRVKVGRQEDMFCREVELSGVNWMEEKTSSGIRVQVQLRYLMRPRDAELVPCEDGRARIVFDEKAPLAPSGQQAVAYCGDKVVAGGWIENCI